MKGPVRAFSVDSDAEAKSVTELILPCEQRSCTQAGPSGWNDAVMDVGGKTTASK